MKVLLVDRSPVVLDRMARMLCEMPCVDTVAQARSGAGARRLAASFRPDVVVIDLSLEWRGGLPLLRDIKRCESSPYIVVLSMETSPTFRARCLEVADACLDKSDDLGALLATLRRLGRAAGEPCSAEEAPGPAQQQTSHGLDDPMHVRETEERRSPVHTPAGQGARAEQTAAAPLAGQSYRKPHVPSQDAPERGRT